MDYCYLCQDETVLTEKNPEEHIIPNFCGGRIKSRRLICGECNGKYNLEANLAKQFHLHTLLNIRRDRGKNPKKQGVLRDGTEIWVYPNGKTQYRGAVVERDEMGNIKAVWASNEQMLVNKLHELKKRDPFINIEEMMKNKIYEKGKGTTLVKFPQYSIGGKDTFRAITKIATNFYIHNGGDKKFIKESIKFIRDEINPFERAYFFYSAAFNIHEIGENEVSHILYLKGDATQGVLYCYVELFSAHCFLVPLNVFYKGPDIESTYAFEIILQKKIDKTISIPLKRQQIIDYTTLWPGQMKKIGDQKLLRIFNIIESMDIDD